jgi:hypothetical protein
MTMTTEMCALAGDLTKTLADATDIDDVSVLALLRGATYGKGIHTYADGDAEGAE